MKGHVIKFEYTHRIDGKNFVGLILISKISPEKYEAAWIDNYHTNLSVMKFDGILKENMLILDGGYHYEQEFWKWTIEISSNKDNLLIQHYNHPPKNMRYLGVDIITYRI